MTLEDSSSRSRLDMTARFNRQMHLFEFKVVEPARNGTSMAQLNARRFVHRCRGRGLPIRLIGVEFRRAERKIVASDAERA